MRENEVVNILGKRVRDAIERRKISYDRLQEIQCPVLVIGGEKDMITTGKASVEIADKLDCRIHMYPEYGHAAYDEAKDFNRIIYEFFSE